MDSLTLMPEPFLGGFSTEIGGTELKEITDVSLLSLAQPLDGQDDLQRSIQALWGCDLPSPGTSATSIDKSTSLLCLGSDTFLALLSTPDQLLQAQTDLGTAAYTTDQSDNWVTLRLVGPLARPALERICPVDLHPMAMPPGSFARTSMEHLGTIVLCEGPDKFRLMSASSSARSFLHAVETSIKYVS